MPKPRKTSAPTLPTRYSKYADTIAMAKSLRLGEWLELPADEYTSQKAGRVCVRQALNRSPVLDAIRDRKVFVVNLLANGNIGIQAVRPS